MARVLIADDSAFIRRHVRTVAEAAGHEVVGETDDGNRVVGLYRSLRPDLCTLDITMFGQSGIEALREIVREDPDARVVICSSMAQRQNALEAVRLGARDFVVKPFDGARLSRAIDRALAGTGAGGAGP